MTEARNAAANLPSDAALIEAVRRGDTTAYGVLYQRHLAAARRVARALLATTAEREDLIAEAFTRVLHAMQSGRGPTGEFRPYLLAALRNIVISAHRRSHSPAVSLYAEVPEARRVGGREDPTDSRVHAAVAADAFASLPERWRVVLWHTEIEGESPTQVAQLLGMNPNSVAALAYRAREGLRQAYLEQHLPTLDDRGCRTIASQLAGWVRRGFGPDKMRSITAHLDRCATCRTLATDMAEINSQLRSVVAPVILGAPVAMTYLSAPTGTALSSGTVLSAAASTGISTASWLTAVKTVVAGAALATATAVTTVASDPMALPADNAIAASVPAQQSPTPTAPLGPGRTGSNSQAAVSAPAPTAFAPQHADTAEATGTGDALTPAPTTKAAKQEKKATAKQEAKQAKKDARAEDKKAKKQDKAAAKETKKAK